MSRYDLTDFEWRVIEPLLPNKPSGVPRVDDRRGLDGLFLGRDPARPGVICQSGMARALPATTAFVRWRKAGVWGRMMDAITAAHHGDIQMIDSTSVRAHQ